MALMAAAAYSLTLGSNSSKQPTNGLSAPASTTFLANVAECLETARRTKAAAFL